MIVLCEYNQLQESQLCKWIGNSIIHPDGFTYIRVQIEEILFIYWIFPLLSVKTGQARLRWPRHLANTNTHMSGVHILMSNVYYVKMWLGKETNEQDAVWEIGLDGLLTADSWAGSPIKVHETD